MGSYVTRELTDRHELILWACDVSPKFDVYEMFATKSRAFTISFAWYARVCKLLCEISIE